MCSGFILRRDARCGRRDPRLWGFAGDPELVGRHIIGGPGRMRVRAHPRSTGDGFRAALQKGALASAGLDEFYGRNPLPRQIS